MSLDPLGTTSRVYSFIKQRLPEHVKQHLLSISDGSKKHKEVEMEMGEDGKMRPKNIYALDVFKNSTEVVDAWREKFYTMVYLWDMYAIEGQCKELLDRTLGSKVFNVDPVSTRKLKQLYFVE